MYKVSLRRLFLAFVFLVLSLVAYSQAAPVRADEREQQFEQDIEAIRQRIQETHVHLDGVTAEKVTLQEVVADLNKQIVDLQAIIARTQAEIQRLEGEIRQLQNDLAVQTDILKRVLVLLYQNSHASAFELIMSAESFSEYLDNQEYLDRLQNEIGRSVQRIQRLEAELQTEKNRQAKLLAEQQGQEIVLGAARWEQQQLLNETLGQERLFQERLAQLQAEQRAQEEALRAYLASLLASRVSLGPVAAGDIIGKTGNTGFSTGPHLHMELWTLDGEYYDPLVFMENRGSVWPMGGAGGWVSQGFRPGHRALDIAAAESTPIRAIDAGQIIQRGCLLEGNYRTFGVVIDHGDYLSLYIHLQAPNHPDYADCSINRYRQYGVPSIDYSTTR